MYTEYSPSFPSDSSLTLGKWPHKWRQPQHLRGPQKYALLKDEDDIKKENDSKTLDEKLKIKENLQIKTTQKRESTLNHMEIPPLGMVDDLLCISEWGFKTTMLNTWKLKQIAKRFNLGKQNVRNCTKENFVKASSVQTFLLTVGRRW